MKSRKAAKTLCIAALLAAGGAAAIAQARENDSTSSDQGLAEIVVTAQKRSQNLQEVPLAVSALGGEALADRHVTSLLDLQTIVPNISLQQRQASGVVTIRGIGFDIITAGADSSVAVHSDGVYVSRPPAALAGIYDVDRIEIARGPQGTLYGRNATGGAINIITRKPTAEPEGYIDISAGDYRAFTLASALSGPLVKDVLLGRIAVKLDDHAGYGTNLYNGRDIDNLSSRAVRAELLFNASEKVNFLLIGDSFTENDNAFAMHYAGPYTPDCSGSGAAAILTCPVTHGFTLPADLNNVDQDVQTENRRRFNGVNLTSTFNLDWARLVSITAYRRTHSYYRGDLDGTSKPLATNFTREEDANQTSQEFQLTGTARQLDWLAGLYYFHETDFARANAFFASPVPAPLVGPFFQGSHLTTDAYAGFGQGTYRITQKLSATVGGRYSREKRQIAGEELKIGVSDTLRSTLPLETEATFTAFTPRAGLEYKFDPDKLGYVAVQKGFKSGGFASGSLQPHFASETIWDYEAGLKATWLEDRLLTNVAMFHYDYRNLQQGVVLGTSTIIGNVPKAKVDGAELELKAKITSHVRIDANGGYLRARFGSYSNIDGGRGNTLFVLDGNSLTQAPKWSGTLGAEYALRAFAGELALRGEAYGVARVYFSPFNVPQNSQPGYALENAYLSWNSDNGAWSFSAFGKNLGNKTALTGTFVSAAFVGAALDAAVLPPRTFGFRAGWRF